MQKFKKSFKLYVGRKLSGSALSLGGAVFLSKAKASGHCWVRVLALSLEKKLGTKNFGIRFRRSPSQWLKINTSFSCQVIELFVLETWFLQYHK
ncbi:unnamed protein product [Prunus armeniaca]|uniref:Uncharacterized protein n=1 Tax=Prunus armeniaca TaxID=36596 RepID=A0A6J5XTQ3_PRUAR|nr:unnamed protein product [Prunus armeniaca]CAB4315763.1 unnamed protein product [Prunus armeniaca]